MWLQLFSGAQTRPAFVLVLLLRTDGIDTGIDVNLDNVFPLHFGAVLSAVLSHIMSNEHSVRSAFNLSSFCILEQILCRSLTSQK